MISVIVCTYNRAKYLKTCLEHLANQKSPADRYEIVIINNNSPDNSDAIIVEFINSHQNLNIVYHIEYNQGHTYARNAGITKSSGEILSFIDDDAFPDPNFIHEIEIAFKDPKVMAIGGKIKPVYETGKKPVWMSKYLLPLVSALDMGNDIKPFKGTKHPIGANMAFKRAVFQKIGNFDVNLGRRGIDGLEGGDEKDLFFKLKEYNMLIQYHPKVFVEHIIGKNRTTENYVKGLAVGVGSSEKKRLKGGKLLLKWGDEMIKLGGSMILFVLYAIRLRFSAALMLIKFRFWVIKGLLI